MCARVCVCVTENCGNAGPNRRLRGHIGKSFASSSIRTHSPGGRARAGGVNDMSACRKIDDGLSDVHVDMMMNDDDDDAAEPGCRISPDNWKWSSQPCEIVSFVDGRGDDVRAVRCDGILHITPC